MAQTAVTERKKIEPAIDEHGGMGTPLPLRLSQIVPMPGQPRKEFDEKSIELLADSIQADGQNTAVIVCKHAEESGKFVLIGGERRWRAFHLIQRRTGIEPTIKANIDTVRDHKEHYVRAFIDNVFREDLTPLDEANAYCDLENYGCSVADIVRMTGKSRTHIDNYLRVHRLPDSVKNLVLSRQLNISQAVEIAKCGASDGYMIDIALEICRKELSLAETRSLLEIRTGKSSYGIGGRLSKPSDDYRALTTLLGRTYKSTKNMREKVEIRALYRHRDDERQDRANDAEIIRAIIQQFELMLEDITKKE